MRAALARNVHRPQATRLARLHAGSSEITDSAPRFSAGEVKEGASTDLGVLWTRLRLLALPYFTSEESKFNARLQLVGVLALTFAGTAVSVWFNFLGRDFFNALSEKNEAVFWHQLVTYLSGFAVGIPVFITKDFLQSKMSIDWRQWMTRQLLEEYLDKKCYYRINMDRLVDNPDQRLTSDINAFTDTALSLFLVILSSVTDLVSFSGILYQIYPPLFLALFTYAVGGTALSLRLGQPLIPLNFNQERREADFRYSLVRLRENSESVAFFGGERIEGDKLQARLRAAVENLTSLLVVQRNLSFFTSFYRYLIILLPTAVVAPLYFRGEIELGVVTQSNSAFSHILNDVSLVVLQLEVLASFSAVVDRLGEFAEALESSSSVRSGIAIADRRAGAAGKTLLEARGLTLWTPKGTGEERGKRRQEVTAEVVAGAGTEKGGGNGVSEVAGRGGNGVAEVKGDDVAQGREGVGQVLVREMELEVVEGRSLLVMGPSGAGKTTILRSLAGLWPHGTGSVTRYGEPVRAGMGKGDVMFVPQRPYLPLGMLRDIVLYPMWRDASGRDPSSAKPFPGPRWVNTLFWKGGFTGLDDTLRETGKGSERAGKGEGDEGEEGRAAPTDEAVLQALTAVGLEKTLERFGGEGGHAKALEAEADWSAVLSVGEQQRVAFARLLLAKPKLALMDESTSALDTENEERMYRGLKDAGVTFVSIGHRPTLAAFHEECLYLSPGGAWRMADTPKEAKAGAEEGNV